MLMKCHWRKFQENRRNWRQLFQWVNEALIGTQLGNNWCFNPHISKSISYILSTFVDIPQFCSTSYFIKLYFTLHWDVVYVDISKCWARRSHNIYLFFQLYFFNPYREVGTLVLLQFLSLSQIFNNPYNI